MSKISLLESKLTALKNKKEEKHSSNKREKFVDIANIIEENKELKALNHELTNNLEDLKRENEIILEDYRKIQINFNELQSKYQLIVDEKTQLKNSLLNLRNVSMYETRTAAEKPRTFFEREKETNSYNQKWSENHFGIKKTEFPFEFTKSKWVNVTMQDDKKSAKEMRLSNYLEKEDFIL